MSWSVNGFFIKVFKAMKIYVSRVGGPTALFE
jgi:hypothetical protein